MSSPPTEPSPHSSPSYRRGVLITLATVLAAALVSLALGPAPTRPSAGQDLGAAPYPLGPFHLVERSGRVIDSEELAGRVWIAAFIFTRCPASCPRITSVMKGLQGSLERSNALLVSITVDPDHDSPEVLARYAETFGARPDRWWFLTGDPGEVHRLVFEHFHLPMTPASPEAAQAGAEAIAHSAKLALVDRGNRVVGYFDSTNPTEIRELIARATRLDRAWVGQLPALNASLNGACTILLLLGWSLVRARRLEAHRWVMLAALAVSVLFLASYLTYHAMIGGGTPFRGTGALRWAYFTVLISHVVLAAAVVPLMLVTLARGLAGRFERHASIAAVTLPIWLYVSVTGVVVYLMLYRM